MLSAVRFAYAKANNVQLLDEYDQIDRDIAPFAALEPVDFAHRNKVMGEREHTFSLRVENGAVSTFGPFGHIERAKDLGDIIARFSADLPHDFNM